MARLDLSAQIEPIPAGRQVTCWVHACTRSATWLITLTQPILGTPLFTLCDEHLYDFETETRLIV